MGLKKVYSSAFIFMTVFLVFMCLASFASAEEKERNLPARGISVAPEYTGVVISQDEDASVDLIVKDLGRRDEDIDLAVTSVPKGWNAKIQTYSFGITGVHVESDKSKSLTLKVEPAKGSKPGEYPIKISAKTDDGKFRSSSQLMVTIKPKEKMKKEARGVNITTSYPVLEGPTDAKLEFSIEVENKTDKDDIFNLSYEGPKDWDINFKPAYEDKYFSSLRIKTKQSQTLAVEVKPYPEAEPGRYPIKVKVSSGIASGEVELTVVLTGTYKLDVGTSNGLLSLDALQGKEANLSFYIRNTGSATQNNIKFLSFKPENWKVKFNPENIETLAPGELKQVEVTITPGEQALVGDYSVNLSVNGEKATKNLELRVTVKASTAWGWIGIGIIVLVIAGLVTMFVRLGRR